MDRSAHRGGVTSPEKDNSPLEKGVRGLSFLPYPGVGAYCHTPVFREEGLNSRLICHSPLRVNDATEQE